MAFGNTVPDDILTAPRLGPSWAITCANVMVFVHMISGFQVFSQPVFAGAEPLLRRTFPTTAGRLSHRTLSLVFRTAYVVTVTLVACLMCVKDPGPH